MKFTPLHLLNFGMNPKLDHIPVCMLLKLDYAKFGVSSLFLFSKVIEEKHLGGIGSTPPPPPPIPLGKRRVK